jgi:hypothetical protein
MFTNTGSVIWKNWSHLAFYSMSQSRLLLDFCSFKLIEVQYSYNLFSSLSLIRQGMLIEIAPLRKASKNYQNVVLSNQMTDFGRGGMLACWG